MWDVGRTLGKVVNHVPEAGDMLTFGIFIKINFKLAIYLLLLIL